MRLRSSARWSSPATSTATPTSRASGSGYLRYGEKVAVIPEAHKKSNCVEGWYELLAGGFVCGKYATLDLDHPRFKLAGPPDLVSALPYVYGVNYANGTPLYRSIPSRKERLKYEPWLLGRPHKAKVEDDANPSATPAAAPDGGLAIGEDAGVDAPWWEKESPDGGPPAITLDELQGGRRPSDRAPDGEGLLPLARSPVRGRRARARGGRRSTTSPPPPTASWSPRSP